jgi:hypothetical protein
MESTAIRTVHDLPSNERQALEQLLGRPLDDQQHVFIMAFTPGVAPDEATRADARRRLEQTFARAEQHAREKVISADEADAAVAEAMQHVRKRPQ